MSLLAYFPSDFYAREKWVSQVQVQCNDCTLDIRWYNSDTGLSKINVSLLTQAYFRLQGQQEIRLKNEGSVPTLQMLDVKR